MWSREQHSSISIESQQRNQKISVYSVSENIYEQVYKLPQLNRNMWQRMDIVSDIIDSNIFSDWIIVKQQMYLPPPCENECDVAAMITDGVEWCFLGSNVEISTP